MKLAKIVRPTRLDHFPNTGPQPQAQFVGERPRKRMPFSGSGDTLKMWLENHGLPVDKNIHKNIDTMERATGA